MASAQKVQTAAGPTAKRDPAHDAGAPEQAAGIDRELGVETDPEATHATRERIGQTGVGGKTKDGPRLGLPESDDPPRPGGDPLGEAAGIEPPSGVKSGRR
jgi:hypothetical protein